MTKAEIRVLQREAKLAAEHRLDTKNRIPWPRFVEAVNVPRAHEATVAKRFIEGKNNLHSDWRSLEFYLVDSAPDEVLTYTAKCVRCDGEGTIEVQTCMDRDGETIWPPTGGVPELCDLCENRLDAAYEAQAARAKTTAKRGTLEAQV